MQITIDSKKLRKAIEQVLPAVGNRASLPVLREILMQTVCDEAGQVYLELAATNLEITLWSRVALPSEDLEQEGSFTVNPSELINALKRLRLATRVKLQLQRETSRNDKGEEVTISYLLVTPSLGSKETETALIKLTDLADQFPQLPDPSFAPEKSMKASVSDFLAGIKRVVFAASTDETRPIYTGVWATVHPAKLGLAACDTFRLATTEIPLLDEFSGKSNSTSEPLKLIIPAQPLKALVKAITSDSTVVSKEVAGEPAQITLSLNATGAYLVFKVASSITCVISLIEGKIPNYHSYITTDSKVIFRVNTKEFKETLARLMKAEAERVRSDRSVERADKLVLQQSGDGKELFFGLFTTDLYKPEMRGEAAIKVANVESFTISFPYALKADYLQGVLAAVADDYEQIEVRLNSSIQPSLFRPVINGAATETNWVIMPMHVSGELPQVQRQSLQAV